MIDEESSRRFDRIETKIDKLTDILASVARVEEKMIGADARLKRHEFRLDENERKVDDLAESVATNSQVVKVGQGIVASVWAAFIGAVIYIVKD
jgi:hypothetical protein|tara:strand:+ start:1994 stop:2275 length:282 start_codon:yes stop_codon:yes gene_type:complete